MLITCLYFFFFFSHNFSLLLVVYYVRVKTNEQGGFEETRFQTYGGSHYSRRARSQQGGRVGSTCSGACAVESAFVVMRRAARHVEVLMALGGWHAGRACREGTSSTRQPHHLSAAGCEGAHHLHHLRHQPPRRAHCHCFSSWLVKKRYSTVQLRK